MSCFMRDFTVVLVFLSAVSGPHRVTQDIKQHTLYNSEEVSLVYLCSLLIYHLQNVLTRREYSIFMIGMGVLAEISV